MMRLERSSGIANLIMDMPDRAANVWNQESLDAFTACLDEVIADEAIGGLIISSAKSSFLAGGDLAQILIEFENEGGRDSCPLEEKEAMVQARYRWRSVPCEDFLRVPGKSHHDWGGRLLFRFFDDPAQDMEMSQVDSVEDSDGRNAAPTPFRVGKGVNSLKYPQGRCGTPRSNRSRGAEFWSCQGETSGR